MFFRFSAALFLIVLVSMASVWLEKQTLELHRSVARQHYQCDVLLDMIVQSRLETQRLSADRLTRSSDTHGAVGDQRGSRAQPVREKQSRRQSALPLLQFPDVFDPKGIER